MRVAEDPLAHPTRSAIVQLVRRQPGITVTALAMRLRMNRRNVWYHVRVLIGEKLVERRQSVGNQGMPVVLTRPVATRDVEAHKLMRNPLMASIIKALIEERGICVVRIARMVGVSTGRVRNCLASLEARDMAWSVKAGRELRFFLEPAVARSLRRDEPGRTWLETAELPGRVEAHVTKESRGGNRADE